MDGALREAAGLPQRAAATLAQWADAAEWLGLLAAARFAAAAPEKAGDLLDALRERFGNLFFEIDTELLDATDRVIRAAEVLDALLTRFLP